jgi:hypothetical protein
VLLAGLVLALGPGREPACLASDDDGSRVVQSPSAVEFDFVDAGDAEWQIVPDVDRTQFGQSVASAGNVDSYYGPDIIVGAPKDETINGKGAAYLYLGTGGGLGATASWEMGGGSDAVNFGSAVAGVGDVNDDGIDDAIVADNEYKATLEINGEQKEVKAGGAFVYEGIAGVGLSSEPIWSYTGAVKEGEFGCAVAGAGDLNGDGIDDIVVGARWYTDQPDTEPNKHNGAVYVFYGGSEGSSPSATPDWFLFSTQAGAWFGASVSAAGDVNHDGYDDLLVGAPGTLNPDTGVQEGAVFLFLGRDTEVVPPPTSVTDAAWIAYGGQEGSGFGTVAASAGDVNGDGRPDAVVSTPRYDRPSDGVEVGAAFAYCGNGATFGSDPCWSVYGDQPAAQFGASAAGAGDVNGDGFDDVVVGVPTYIHYLSDTYHPEGAAYLYFGSAEGLASWSGWKARGDKSRTDFGASVSSAGDVDSDGTDGIIIGAPQYFKYEGTPYGAAFAFYGPLDPAEMFRTYLPLVQRSAD